jgi:hypothetical protein
MGNLLSKKEVMETAYKIFRLYVYEMGWTGEYDYKVNLKDIYDSVIYPEYEFDLRTDINLGYLQDERVLGKTIPNDRIILIDPSINQESKDPRYTFTFSHEIGHAIMHSKNKQYFRCTNSSISNEKDLFEVQANIFAQNLIMPYPLVKYRLYKYYRKENFIYTGKGRYGFNSSLRTVDSLMDYCRQLASPLTSFFSNISKESFAYAIFNLGFIINHTNETLDSTLKTKIILGNANKNDLNRQTA